MIADSYPHKMVGLVDTSGGREVQVRCDCGNLLEADTEISRVSCDCGKVFAVTVTEMDRYPSTKRV
jgi:hypothetical protein